MPYNKLNFDEITPELLRQRTEAYAFQISNKTRNADSLHNWIEAKKLVAFSIVDSYLQNCMETSRCPSMPECCREYLKELSIQDAKRLKAYFIWESRGNRTEEGNDHLSDYGAAYKEIIPFCAVASENATNCRYLIDVLFTIEKRKIVDRRAINKPISAETIRDARLNSDRRKNGRMSIIDEFLRNNSPGEFQRISAQRT